MPVPPIFKTFWDAFLATSLDPADAIDRFYEACRFGHTADNATKTATLVLQGEKTATGSLLLEFEVTGKPLPNPGALTIIVDGADRAVGVIETTDVRVVPFADIGAQFAYDYGEGDRDLEFWHAAMWPYYAEECQRFGGRPSKDMALVCEYFRLVYPEIPQTTH